MNENDILQILVDWNYWGNFRVQLKNRPDYLGKIDKLFSGNTALVLSGIRRSGKSSLIHLFLQDKISKEEVKENDILFINLEDPRLLGSVTSADLPRIFDFFLQQASPQQPIVVLDEVQNVHGWERFVRLLLETGQARVIVTGSSSKLMSPEIASTLTGRHVDVEVFPLTFMEMLEFEAIPYANRLEIAKNRIKIIQKFQDYFQWGGFPEVVLSETPERKKELLFRYFDDILHKDIARRFNIQRIDKLEQMGNLLLANISTTQSFNKIKKHLGISLDTVERFAKYFEIARLFFFIKKFDYSLKQQYRSINKVYVADIGFYWARGFRFSENSGRLIENLVAIELLKKRAQNPALEVYYWKDPQQREVDFVVKEGMAVKQLIQVCWDLSETHTMKREISALIHAGATLKCNNLLIITRNLETIESFDKNSQAWKIHFLPLWKWLISSG